MPERRFSGWDLEAWKILLKEIWNCETFEVVDTKVYFLLSLFDADKDHHKRTWLSPSFVTSKTLQQIKFHFVFWLI